MTRLAPLAAAAAILLATGASAQAVSGVSFDAGAGLRYAPDYLGSEDHEAKPWLILRNLSFSDAPAGAPADGFHIAPSADYVGGRDPKDNDHLAGLDKIDRSIELGVKAGYRMGPVDGYAAIRKGFGGSSGVVGELGLKHRAELSDRLSLTSGIEAQYGDDKYMDTWFGVSPAEAAASGLAAYEPAGGVRSVSASLEMRYQATDAIAVLGQVRAGRLVGDAADSPVVQDKNQLSVGLGVVRHFSFKF